MHCSFSGLRFSSAAKMERVENIINNKYVKLMAVMRTRVSRQCEIRVGSPSWSWQQILPVHFICLNLSSH